MRKFSLFLLGSSLLFLTSCFDIIEELYLNKDGSGKYVTRIDMSSMMDNPMMKGMMDKFEKEKPESDATAIPLEKDSIISFTDFEGFENLSLTEKDKMKGVHIRMQMSEKDKKMLITMVLPFQTLSDLADINAIMQKLDEQKTAGDDDNAGLMGGGNPLGNKAAPSFQLKRRKLTRLPGPALESLFGDKENVDMMKMFLDGATSTTIYHLPGKVKKCTIPDAVIDGKTVTVKSSTLDILNKKVKLEGYIKYKRR